MTGHGEVTTRSPGIATGCPLAAIMYRDTIYIDEGEQNQMLAMRLVRLIEAHSGELCLDLTEQIAKSERTSDFKKIPAEQLRLAASEVYRHLGEWLLQKTESDIETRFRAVAAQRAAEGIRLHQFVWALLLSRDRLWHFLRHQSLADNVVALYGELELQRLLNQFFDRAIYYAILGYEEAGDCRPKGELARVRDLAISIGLISSKDLTGTDFDEPGR
jgi:hypothetical protein